MLIGTILVLISVPVFIQHLGSEKYGIFSLVLITSNFTVFLGLGVNSSLLKFLSEQGKSRESDIDIIIATGLLVFSYIPYAIICFFNNEAILKLLGVPHRYINSDTITFFNLLIAANFIQFVNQIPVSILDSLQKIYLTNLYQTIYQTIYWTLIITSIFLYGTFKMIGLSVLFSTVVWYILLNISTIKYWGALKINWTRREMLTGFKKQVGYSFKLYISNLLNFFYEPLTKILISSFIGVSEVGYYDIILRIRTQVWNTLSKLLYPLFPLISKLKDKTAVRFIVHDIEQKLTYAVLFFTAVIIFTIPDFVQVWLKNQQDIISIPLILILLGNLLAVIVMPMYQFLVLKGYPGNTIILQAINVFVNTAVFFLFYNVLGFFAVAWANVAAILSSFILCLFYQWKYLDSLIFENRLQSYKTIALFMLLIVSGYIIDQLITNPFMELLLLPAILLLLNLMFIRFLRIITLMDIIKYSGENKVFRDLLLKIFSPAGSNHI